MESEDLNVKSMCHHKYINYYGYFKKYDFFNKHTNNILGNNRNNIFCF